MKKVIYFALVLITKFSFSQNVEINKVKQLLSHDLSQEWLNCVTINNVAYKNRALNGNDIYLIKVPDCNTKDEKGMAMFILSGSRIIHFEESEYENNFSYLADVKTVNFEYVIFIHYSSIGSYVKYYFVNLKTGVGLTTPNIYRDWKIDYLSINFDSKIFKYIDEDNTEYKNGDLTELVN